MEATLVSVCIGEPRMENFYGKQIFTAIRKKPFSNKIYLNKTGLEGDGVGDKKHHGGEDKALCLYPLEHYPYWEKTLSIKLPVAAFGENLTTIGLLEEHVFIGDIFEIGTALIQVSQPRQPCSTLAARYNRKDLIKMVIDTGYTGFYFRVIKEGYIKEGEPILLKKRVQEEVSISFANNIRHKDRTNCEAIKKILSIEELSESWHKDFEQLANKACI
ncbi:MAG: MOSC domain-containing protein [Nitrospirae bacterium]|nr:MAG: MOSC domain-containing protein [Nitrospirota bacterium]